MEPKSTADINTKASLQTITANSEHKGLRADVFLCGQLKDVSRSQISSWLKSGIITSSTKKPSSILQGGETFRVTFQPPSKSFMASENIPLEIIYCDDHIAVINKPKGMVVHPGAGAKSGTLCNALLHHFPDMAIGNVERPGLVHRLDKDTSGIMVIAKNNQALNALTKAFKDRKVKKIYRAFCFGKLPIITWDVKSGHRRHPLQRLKFTTHIDVPTEENQEIRFAHTTFKELKHAFGISFIEAQIHTGRTHQIRAHLADRGFPIIGDELYGKKRTLSKNVQNALQETIERFQGQALHAYKLEFDHPILGTPLSFSAPMPAIFDELSALL